MILQCQWLHIKQSLTGITKFGSMNKMPSLNPNGCKFLIVGFVSNQEEEGFYELENLQIL